MDNKVYRNMFFAFFAQGISILLSIFTSLILPKFLDVTSYGYWQLFIFYSIYINILHFGISDGIYLRIGGKDYRDLDKDILKSQFIILLFIQILFSIIFYIIGRELNLNDDRMFVLLNLCIYMLVFNSLIYFGFIFQAINETRIYSTAIIIDKVIFIIYLNILLLKGYRDYRLFIVGYSFAAFVGLIYILLKGKDILLSRFLGLQKTIKEMIININVGIKLMISAVASNFIVGSARMVVDKSMGINEFGKLSFSFSIINFLLVFIRQVSMVLFPALRRMDEEYLSKFFDNISSILDLLMPIILIGYYPISIFLSSWVPKYNESLFYLKYLLPIVVFDGKAQLLFFTFMKVFREEDKLLKINVFCMVLSAISSYLILELTSNILYVVFVLMIIICLRSIFMEMFLRKKYFSDSKSVLHLTIIVVIFLVTSTLLKDRYAMITYTIFYLCYVFLKRKDLQLLKKIRHL